MGFIWTVYKTMVLNLESKIYANGIDITTSHTEVGTYLKMNNTNSTTKFGQAGFSASRPKVKTQRND
jgi:hypothetical protein